MALEFLNSSGIPHMADGGDASSAIAAMYESSLGRAADAGGLAYWSGLANSGTSLADIQSAISGSSEAQSRPAAPAAAPSAPSYSAGAYTPAYSAPTPTATPTYSAPTAAPSIQPGLSGSTTQASNADPISQIYQNTLGRAPDAGGLAYYQQLLANGTPLSQIQSQIQGTAEASTPTAQISQLYQSQLGRAPDDAGLQYYQQQLANGTSLDQIRNSILSSSEGANSPVGQITKAYQDALGRAPDASGLEYYKQQLTSGKSIDQIKAEIAGSEEANPKDYYESSATFNADKYLAENPDLYSNAQYSLNPYQHYLDWGKKEGRKASFDVTPEASASDKWTPISYTTDADGNQIGKYYRDEATGNVYDSNGENAQMIMSGAAAGDKNIQNLSMLDPTQAQALYDLKKTDPSKYYSQVASELGKELSYAYRTAGGGVPTILNSLEALKEKSPKDYYATKLNFLGEQVGWQIGQNTSYRNEGTLKEIEKVAAEAQAAGLSADQINSLVNNSANQANAQNQKRIAEAAAQGGGFLKGLPELAGLTLAVLAPEFAPALAGSLGVSAGTAATMGSIAGGLSTGAQSGVVMGGLNAALKGGDVWQGATSGGIAGALGGGAIGGLSSGFAAAGVPAAAATPLASGVTAAAKSIMSGQTPAQALQNAGIGAALGAMGNKALPAMTEAGIPPSVAKALIGAAAGGAGSAIRGGDYMSGITSGAIGSLVGSGIGAAKSGFNSLTTGGIDNIAANLSSDPIASMNESKGWTGTGDSIAEMNASQGWTGTDKVVDTVAPVSKVLGDIPQTPTTVAAATQASNYASSGMSASQIADSLSRGFPGIDTTDLIKLADNALTATMGSAHASEVGQPAANKMGPEEAMYSSLRAQGMSAQEATNVVNSAFPESSKGMSIDITGVGVEGDPEKAGTGQLTPATGFPDPSISTYGGLIPVNMIDTIDTTKLPTPVPQQINAIVPSQNTTTQNKPPQATPKAGEASASGATGATGAAGATGVAGGSPAQAAQQATLVQQAKAQVAASGGNTAADIKTAVTLANGLVGTGQDVGSAIKTAAATTGVSEATIAASVAANGNGTGTGTGTSTGAGTGTGKTGTGSGSATSGTGTGSGGTGEGTGSGTSGTGTGSGKTGTGTGSGGTGSGGGGGGGSGISPALLTGLLGGTLAAKLPINLTGSVTEGKDFSLLNPIQMAQETQAMPSNLPEELEEPEYIPQKASGGKIGNTQTNVPTGKILSGSVTQPNVNFKLIDSPFSAAMKQYANGGEVEGHNPEFFSEGGLNSLKNSYVQGDGDGTSDSVPAMLANGEFVIPADVVASLGNGSNESGSKVLGQFLQTIRAHKQKHDTNKLPPDSKGALAYLLEAKKKTKV